jgi:hypothetical protein
VFTSAYFFFQCDVGVMSDDKSRRGSPDRERIDIHDPDEVRNWTKSLQTTPEKLKAAVEAVGTSAKAVREHLGKH